MMQEAHNGTMEAPELAKSTATTAAAVAVSAAANSRVPTVASWKFRRHTSKSSQVSMKFYDRQERDDDDEDNDQGQLVARDSSVVPPSKSVARRFQWRRHSSSKLAEEEHENAEQQSTANDLKLAADQPQRSPRPPIEDDGANIEHRKLVSSGSASSAENKKRTPLLFRLMNYQMHDTRAPSCFYHKHPRRDHDHNQLRRRYQNKTNHQLIEQQQPTEETTSPSKTILCPKQQIKSNRSSLLLSLLSLSLPVLFVLLYLANSPALAVAAATAEGMPLTTTTSHPSDHHQVPHQLSDDKRAVAELIARRLISTYYQTKLNQNRASASVDERQQQLQEHQQTVAPISDNRNQQVVQQRQWQVDYPTSPADIMDTHRSPAAMGATYQQNSATSSWTNGANIDPSLADRNAQLNAYGQHLAAGSEYHTKATNELGPASDDHLYHGHFIIDQQHHMHQHADQPQNLQQQQQQQQQQHHAFVSYRPSLVQKAGTGMNESPAPTTPTLNKQLVPPPPPVPRYEFGLAPTSTLQLEPATMSSSSGHQNQQQQHQQQQQQQHQQHHPIELLSTAASGMESVVSSSQPADYYAGHLRAAESVARARQHAAFLLQEQPASGTVANSTTGVATTCQRQQGQRQATRGSRQFSGGADTSSGQSSDGSSAESTATGQTSDSKYDQNSSQQQQHTPVEKDVEPRQRRRMFNRILKKAEWNHLFVELSKVFLRYFLDLALKDMIGNKSGTDSSSSSSGDSSTTGRKKLDAQSELANLLKEFVKTAISNM